MVKPPKYEDLNAFMRPSVLSPKYEYPNLRISHDSRKSSMGNTGSNSDADSGSNSELDSDNDSAGECKVSYKTDGSYAASAYSKDLKLYDMKCLLDKKRKSIYDKNSEVKELASDNSYLSSVVSDYDNIQGVVLEEKKNQKMALKILSKHIRNISEHIKHDEFQLQRIREDQQILMDEIEKLRKDISYIHSRISDDSFHIRERGSGRGIGLEHSDEDNDLLSSDYESSDVISDNGDVDDTS